MFDQKHSWLGVPRSRVTFIVNLEVHRLFFCAKDKILLKNFIVSFIVSYSSFMKRDSTVSKSVWNGQRA